MKLNMDSACENKEHLTEILSKKTKDNIWLKHIFNIKIKNLLKKY